MKHCLAVEYNFICKMMELCGLFLYLQSHAYYADIMLDAYVHLHNYYTKNYAGIIDSGIVSINLAMLNNYSCT